MKGRGVDKIAGGRYKIVTSVKGEAKEESAL